MQRGKIIIGAYRTGSTDSKFNMQKVRLRYFTLTWDPGERFSYILDVVFIFPRM